MTTRGANPEELAAEATDAAIAAVLDRRPTPEADPELARLLRHLTVLHEPPAPPQLAAQVQARLEALAPLLVRVLAALLGAVFLGSAVANLLFGPQLARFIGHAYEYHIFSEGGFAYLALGLGALLAAWRPQQLTAALATAVPAGLCLAVFGLTELPHSPNPAAELFHLLQGGLAAALAWAWWRTRPRGGR